MPEAYSFLVFRTCICGYVLMNVHPSVRMCVRTYLSMRMYVHTYVRDPVRLRLRHLYHLYPTAGASVYCRHISSYHYYSDYFSDKIRLEMSSLIFSEK